MVVNLKRLWQLLTPKERRKFFLVLGMVMMMAALEAVGVVSIMPFLAVLGNPDIVTEQPLLLRVYEALGFERPQQFILALGLVSVAIVGASSLFKSVTLHVLNRFANLERHSISSRLLATYLRQPYSFFLSRNSADLSRSLLSEVDQLISNILQPAIQMFAHGVVLLAMVLLLLVYDAALALTVAVIVAVLYAVIYASVRGILGRIGPDRVKANAERFHTAAEVFGAIKEVKVSGSTEAFLQRFNGPSRRMSRHLATNDTLSQVPLYLVEATGYAGLIAIAVFLAMRGDNLGQVLPVLGLYGFAAYRMLPAAQIIYRSFARMRFGASALEHIHRDLMLQVPEPRRTGEPEPLPLPLQDRLDLHSVSYAYPGQSEFPALRNISVTLRANTTVGIVGATGSGKSTLVDLLLGLMPPATGTVRIDGEPLTGTNLRAWQRSIGYVPQQIYIADTSVAENIAFGVRPEAIDHEAVQRAARAAQIHEFVTTELPAGYGTQVGERGVRLSGGQRQRIGIARALYHDPTVLILDEATSALDNVTERAVMAAIRSVSGQKTILMIAHRLSTVQTCDKILLLDHGILTAEGTYEELTEHSPQFRTMAASAH